MTILEVLVLDRISELMDAKPDTDEARELELLVRLQQFYERNIVPGEAEIRAPFTPEQVGALNRYQLAGKFHPFTCGNDSRHRVLLATDLGWVCEDCGYRQGWAYRFMAEELSK